MTSELETALYALLIGQKEAMQRYNLTSNDIKKNF
jgi:hypothetical protein